MSVQSSLEKKYTINEIAKEPLKSFVIIKLDDCLLHLLLRWKN